MRIISAAEVEAALDFDSLVERLRQAFRRDTVGPPRHHHTLDAPEGDSAALLPMPAWQAGRQICIKLVTVFPGSAARGLPSVMGAYLPLDGKTGSPLAMIDGPVLTAKRTAADLFELTRDERAGRRFYDQITLFKSVGSAIEDLAAAQPTMERV